MNYWIKQSWQTLHTHAHLFIPIGTTKWSWQGSYRQSRLDIPMVRGKIILYRFPFLLAAGDGGLCTPDKAQKEVGVVCVSHSLDRIGQNKSDCFLEQSLCEQLLDEGLASEAVFQKSLVKEQKSLQE